MEKSHGNPKFLVNDEVNDHVPCSMTSMFPMKIWIIWPFGGSIHRVYPVVKAIWGGCIEIVVLLIPLVVWPHRCWVKTHPFSPFFTMFSAAPAMIFSGKLEVATHDLLHRLIFAAGHRNSSRCHELKILKPKRKTWCHSHQRSWAQSFRPVQGISRPLSLWKLLGLFSLWFLFSFAFQLIFGDFGLCLISLVSFGFRSFLRLHLHFRAFSWLLTWNLQHLPGPQASPPRHPRPTLGDQYLGLLGFGIFGIFGSSIAKSRVVVPWSSWSRNQKRNKNRSNPHQSLENYHFLHKKNAIWGGLKIGYLNTLVNHNYN